MLVKSGSKAPPLLGTGEESPDDVAIFVPIRIKLESAPTFDAFAFAVIDLVFSLRSDKLNTTVVGRLVPVKAIDRLITVVKDLRTAGTAIDLHDVGDGQERETLQELAADAPFIHFHGYQTNPYPYIKNSDLFLIPSHPEGFSTVMLEALLLRVPVMSTRVSGSSFLEDEQVIDNTTDALRAALHSIVADEDAAENIARASTAGRQKIVDSVSANLYTIEGLLSNSLNAQP